MTTLQQQETTFSTTTLMVLMSLSSLPLWRIPWATQPPSTCQICGVVMPAHIPGFNSQHRPLLDKFLQVPDFAQYFKNILNQVSQNLTNPEIINKRIDALAGLIREDVYWDSSLPRLNLTNVNGSSITAKVLFGNATDLTAIQKNFAGTILNGTVDFEAAVNGTISQQHASLAGIKEWFSKQYNAFNAVDGSLTATMSVVEPIEPTATPVTEAVAIQKVNDDDFTRKTSPVSSSLDDIDLPDNFTR